MFQIAKFVASLSAAGFIIKLVLLLLGIGWFMDFGYTNEWWGTPARLVYITDFNIAYPRQSGIIVNNSDKKITEVRYTINYFRCERNMGYKVNASGCDKLSAPYRGAFEINMGIGPNSTATFDNIEVADYETLSKNPSYNNFQYEVRYVATVTHVS